MSTLRSVIARLAAHTKRTANEGEEHPSMEAIVDEARKWAKGDTYDVELNFKYLIKALKASGNEMFVELDDRVFESASDNAYLSAKHWLNDRGYAELDSEPGYEDLRWEVQNAIYEETNMNVDWNIRSGLLLQTEHSMRGDDFAVATHGMDDEGLLAAFDEEDAAAAIRAAGFTDAQILEILHANNDQYPGIIYLGIVTDNAIDDTAINPTPSGTPILVTHDTINGAGEYVMGKGTITTKITGARDLLNSIDHGSYSLGAVFGTGDWTYA